MVLWYFGSRPHHEIGEGRARGAQRANANISCVLKSVTYRRYEGIARNTRNLAQTALRSLRHLLNAHLPLEKNSKKNSRCFVSPFSTWRNGAHTRSHSQRVE